MNFYLREGSHRREVTQDFSAFLLRSLPSFLSRERFSRPFPPSTVSRILFTHELIALHLLGINLFFCFVLFCFVRKNLSSWITIILSWVHKTRFHGRRGTETAESFSRYKLRVPYTKDELLSKIWMFFELFLFAER